MPRLQKGKTAVTILELRKIYLGYLGTQIHLLRYPKHWMWKGISVLCTSPKLAMISAEGVVGDAHGQVGVSLPASLGTGHKALQFLSLSASVSSASSLFLVCENPVCCYCDTESLSLNKRFITQSIFANCFKSLLLAMLGMLLS